MSQIKVLAKLASSEEPLPGLPMAAFSLCPPCQTERDPLCLLKGP